MAKLVEAAGYLLFRAAPQPQFLLMKHPIRWDLPKGHLDEGESIDQTALRELQEETGIDPGFVWTDPDFRFLLTYNVRYRIDGKDRTKQLTIFLGRLLQHQEISPTEHDGYRWFDWQPPHQIQTQTIDPLLVQVEKYFARQPDWLTKLPIFP